jgi:hypothetical protein
MRGVTSQPVTEAIPAPWLRHQELGAGRVGLDLSQLGNVHPNARPSVERSDLDAEGHSGVLVVARLPRHRGGAEWSQVPIIVLSARGREDDNVKY